MMLADLRALQNDIAVFFAPDGVDWFGQIEALAGTVLRMIDQESRKSAQLHTHARH